MEDKLPTLQEAAIELRQASCKPNDLAQVIDFDSRVEIRQAFTGNQARARSGDPPDGGRRLDVAAQRDLHRAEGAAEGQGGQRGGRPPPGDRRVLRRRGHVEPGVVRGGARPGQALGDVDLRDRAARRRHADARASARPSSSCASWRRRPAAARSSRRSIEDLNGVYTQIADELASQYTVGYTSKNPRRDGAWRRVVVQVARPSITPRTKKGLLRPDGALNLLPLVLYVAAGVAYADPLRPARSRPSAAPRRRCCSSPRSRTPSSSACRRWRCGTCRSPTRRARSRRSCGCWRSSYLYLELTTDERAMGVFILPIIVGAADRSRCSIPGVENRGPGARQPVVLGARRRRCCSPTPASRWPACSALTYVLQFKEIKEKHLGFFYTRLPSLQILDVMNSRAVRSAGCS